MADASNTAGPEEATERAFCRAKASRRCSCRALLARIGRIAFYQPDAFRSDDCLRECCDGQPTDVMDTNPFPTSGKCSAQQFDECTHCPARALAQACSPSRSQRTPTACIKPSPMHEAFVSRQSIFRTYRIAICIGYYPLNDYMRSIIALQSARLASYVLNL